MKRILYTLIIVSLGVSGALAQIGEINGRITDRETGDGIPFANIVVEQNGALKGGTTTDFDGNYSVKPITPGTYDVKVSYVGYQSSVTQGVLVEADKITFLNLSLTSKAEMLDVVEVVDYKVPLISEDETSTGQTITKEEIENLPTRNVQSIASTSAGVFQRDEGDALNIRGARGNGTEYYIDGIRVRGLSAVPATAIEQMTTVTGGVPARYGDATGGIINITTRGPSKNFYGSLELISSEMFDSYGHNMVSGNLSGPILLKNKGTEKEKSFLGFFIAGEYLREKDPDPSAIGMWKIKDEVLDSLEQFPLEPDATGLAFTRTAEKINMTDLEKIPFKQNILAHSVNMSGKVDLQLSDNAFFTLGGTYSYRNNHGYVYVYSLFNPRNNPQVIRSTYRGYARFTQRFGKSETESEDSEENSASYLQNAFYSIQVDYTKDKSTVQDDTHGDNIFNYGYIGNFETFRQPIYAFDTDTLGRSGVAFQAMQDTLVTFQPSDVNPNAARHTTQYYELAGARNVGGVWTAPGDGSQFGYYETVDRIAAGLGLRNGDRPTNIYSMWYNTGRQWNGWSTDNNDQFRLVARGSFDLRKPGSKERNKHAIEFGIEYEQRVDRSYSVSPVGLWRLADQLTNDHIEARDLSNPYYIIEGDTIHHSQYTGDPDDGPVFGANDTILYFPRNVGNQHHFDRNLRTALGLDPDGVDIIDVDAIDPETFSLDMFSADELLNEGSSFTTYYGYDYKGNKLKKQPAYEDFFTDSLNRPIGAFRPVYTAFYIQDKFAFKDLIFNIGLRIDRFDANQKVLKDQYSLYPVKTASEVNKDHPSTIGDDFVVYVDDFTLSEDNITIVGYRDGDTWYNAEGSEIQNPSAIAAAANSTRVTPYLVETDPTKLELTINSFDDYEPQISFMPRIAFSFPISDEALFFAHYDVLTQRPQGSTGTTYTGNVLFARPFEYYYLNAINTNAVISNPNLRPERTIDYQVGFQQRVSPTSALTLSGFYREMKDQVQVTNLEFAYPFSYRTFTNQDFGTVKGITVEYDLRRTRNIRLTANYTLQFAEGTGSDVTAGLSLASEGLPSLRTLVPYNFDQRHTLTATVDYRFESGKDYNGPKWFGKDIFANAGINNVIRLGSGTPFTRRSSPTAQAQFGIPQRSTLKGTINGSRLPSTFRIDTRIDKETVLKFGGKEEGTKERRIGLNVYLRIQNLLNNRNVIAVYSFTGNTDDDGYLASGEGQQTVNTSIDPVSFVSLYNVKVHNPSLYSIPRRVVLGAIISF